MINIQDINFEDIAGIQIDEEIKPTREQLKDKLWRLNNLYKIVTKDGKVIRFILNRAQFDYYKNHHNRNIMLKSRQIGFTTYECIDGFDSILWTRNFYALFISEDDTLARDTFDKKIRFAWDNYREKFKQLYKVDLNSANQLKLDFLSGDYSSIIVRSSGRGGTFHRIHVSEFARICKKYPLKAKEIQEGVFPALTPDGYICIESTAEEEKGLFYEMFWNAWERRNSKLTPIDYKAHFYNWQWDDFGMEKVKPYVVPVEEMEYSEYFKNYQEKHNLSLLEINYYYNSWKNVGKDFNALKKQYPTTPEEAFESSGHKQFNSEVLGAIVCKEPKYKIGNWKIFEEYKEGHIYIAGADVAEGVGQDSSTCIVVDCTPAIPIQVATYKNNNVAPDTFGYELKNGLARYNHPFLGVERNNHGHATLAILKQVYPLDMLYMESRTANKSKNQEDVKKFGFHTNGATKPRIIFDLAKSLEDGIIKVVDAAVKTELRSYDREENYKTTFDPEETQHYDLVMALAICWQMRKHVDLQIGRETIQESDNEYEDALNETLNNNSDLYAGI